MLTPHTSPATGPRFRGRLPSDLQENDVVVDATGGLWVWAGHVTCWMAGGATRVSGLPVIFRPTEFAGRRPPVGLVWLAIAITAAGTPGGATVGISDDESTMPADERPDGVLPGKFHIPLARVRPAELLPILRGPLAVVLPGGGVTESVDVRLADGSSATWDFVNGIRVQ